MRQHRHKSRGPVGMLVAAFRRSPIDFLIAAAGLGLALLFLGCGGFLLLRSYASALATDGRLV